MQVVHAGSWDDAQQAVKSGKADAIVGLYKTEARLPSFTYLDPPIAPDPSAVLVRTGVSFVYNGWNSLIGKKGVANVGEVVRTQLRYLRGEQTRTSRPVHGNKAVYQSVVERAGRLRADRLL